MLQHLHSMFIFIFSIFYIHFSAFSSENQKNIIVVIGPPASGKGTQGQMIREKYNLPHLSAGDIFRTELRENTYLGRMIRFHDEQNPDIYTPDEVAFGLMAKRTMQDDCDQGYILDGYPRTTGQANFVCKTLASGSNVNLIVIALELNDLDIYKRVKSRFICNICGEQHRAHDSLLEDLEAKPYEDTKSLKIEKCSKTLNCTGFLEARREDSCQRTVSRRIELYRNDLAIIKEILPNRIHTILQDQNTSPEEVFKMVKKAIDANLKREIMLSFDPIFDWIPTLEISTAIIETSDGILMLLRSKEEDQQNLYCIPGGKIERSENPFQALVRELKEELGQDVIPNETPEFSVFAFFGDFYYKCHIFTVPADQLDMSRISLNPTEHSEFKFIAFESICEHELILGQEAILNHFYKKELIK